jgi:flavorubredoxin
MKSTIIYEGKYQWIAFGRDPDKPEKIIDTNQYMIIDGNHSLLMDPGGIEIFSSMLSSVLRHTDIENITDIFASHQDPDIISSLGLWDYALPNAILHAPWIWEGFIRHFGLNNIKYNAIPDEGKIFALNNAKLTFIPAHYLHSSGNFHVYDPEAKVLMSGDVGAALEKPGASIYVDDFDKHISKMKLFHQRWMPSNRAKQAWIDQVRKLDIEYMAPQHGRIFRGKDVQKFLDWFEDLEVGIIIK